MVNESIYLPDDLWSWLDVVRGDIARSRAIRCIMQYLREVADENYVPNIVKTYSKKNTEPT